MILQHYNNNVLGMFGKLWVTPISFWRISLYEQSQRFTPFILTTRSFPQYQFENVTYAFWSTYINIHLVYKCLLEKTPICPAAPLAYKGISKGRVTSSDEWLFFTGLMHSKLGGNIHFMIVEKHTRHVRFMTRVHSQLYNYRWTKTVRAHISPQNSISLAIILSFESETYS